MITKAALESLQTANAELRNQISGLEVVVASSAALGARHKALSNSARTVALRADKAEAALAVAEDRIFKMRRIEVHLRKLLIAAGARTTEAAAMRSVGVQASGGGDSAGGFTAAATAAGGPPHAVAVPASAASVVVAAAVTAAATAAVAVTAVDHAALDARVGEGEVVRDDYDALAPAVIVGAEYAAPRSFTEEQALDEAMSGRLGAPANFAVAELLRLQSEVEELSGVRASLTAATLDAASARAEVAAAMERVAAAEYRPPTANAGDQTTLRGDDIDEYLENIRQARAGPLYVCAHASGGPPPRVLVEVPQRARLTWTPLPAVG